MKPFKAIQTITHTYVAYLMAEDIAAATAQVEAGLRLNEIGKPHVCLAVLDLDLDFGA